MVGHNFGWTIIIAAAIDDNYFTLIDLMKRIYISNFFALGGFCPFFITATTVVTISAVPAHPKKVSVGRALKRLSTERRVTTTIMTVTIGIATMPLSTALLVRSNTLPSLPPPPSRPAP